MAHRGRVCGLGRVRVGEGGKAALGTRVNEMGELVRNIGNNPGNLKVECIRLNFGQPRLASLWLKVLG